MRGFSYTLQKIHKECLVCGKHIGLAEWWPASVDDGRLPGTPNRWRVVGRLCSERCLDQFENERGER